MSQSIIGEVKKLDVLIGKKMYQCKKEKELDTIPSPFQMKILEYLIWNEDNSINQKDLEDELKVSKAAISGTIKSMEDNGLIKRKQSMLDARAKDLVVTRKGKEEFEKMQSGQPFEDVDGRQYDAIRRPIGQWNCMHFAMSFSTRYSVRKYTNAQLEAMAAANAAGCEINGRHLSLYRCSQTMRELETQVRREMDAANAARAAGDADLRRDCQRRINSLNRRYLDIAKPAGLKPRRERMYVRGFRMVKV